MKNLNTFKIWGFSSKKIDVFFEKNLEFFKIATSSKFAVKATEIVGILKTFKIWVFCYSILDEGALVPGKVSCCKNLSCY